MRKKIWKMSEGQFNMTVPRIVIEPNVIEKTIVEGETFDGSFSILCDKSNPTKGLVYCDNPYIYINTPAFNEENSIISYKISAKYLHANDKLEGFFYIYSDSKVTKLPFTIEVVMKYPRASTGEIKNLNDFSELAKRSFKEAGALFLTPEFGEIMNKESDDVRLLYKGFKNSYPSDANLEEFLTASCCKERVYFDMNTQRREYSFVSTNLKESIDITRNTWGYIKLYVTSDSDFISVENNVITSDFFLGSKLTLNYYIHKDRMHSGKNLGMITVRGMGIIRRIEIIASADDLYEKKKTDYIEYKKKLFSLYKTYEDYRLLKIDSATWAKHTVKKVDEILSGDTDKRLFLRLVKTHALIVAKESQEALVQIKSLRLDIVDKKSSEWAYLLYLGALIDPQEEYVDRLRKEIESIQDNHPEDVKLFWFLLFLKKEYIKNPGEKLHAIKHWIKEGYESPILYAECYALFLENPYSIDSFSDFNMKILNWAVKRDGLTESVCERIFDLLLKTDGFDENVFALFLKAYEVLPSDMHLKHIISYMLKGNVKGEKYAEIYNWGIEANLKLNGLFEAYINSLPLNYIDRLSDITLRYFSYNSNISDERKAFVYSNIIMYKKENPVMYDLYKDKIRDFCMEQMRFARLDDNISICYQDIIDTGIIDSRLSDGISKILFAKKVICLHEDAKRIIIIEDAIDEANTVELKDGVVFLPIYSGKYKVFIEMSDGGISCDDKLYYVENTINYKEKYEELLLNTTDKKMYFLHDLFSMENDKDIKDVYEEEAIDFMFNDDIDPFYLKKHFNLFVKFFKNHLREDIILSALLHNNRYESYDINVLTYLVNLLIIDGEDERAINLLRDHIILNADKRQILMCLRRYIVDPSVSMGEYILELCIHLLREGYHTEETVEYLLNHFIGLSSDMRLIFKYANPDSESLFSFCERFIIQGLFSGDIDKDDDEIMISYLENKANPMIVEAYMSYFSHKYIIEDVIPPDSVFAILNRQLRLTDSVNDSLRFAYCKYLCKKSDLSMQEESMLNLLINNLLSRNIYFPFFSDMAEKYIMKYHLYDRMYININTTPGKDLVLYYTYGDDRVEIDIPENYYGIYTKALVLFFGESIHYSIYEKDKKDSPLLTGEYSYQDLDYPVKSRFYSLNDMHKKKFFKEFQALTEDVIEYNRLVEASKGIFKAL